MTNKEKFLALVSTDETNTLEKNKERINNRAKLRESQNIAIKILFRLDELGWKQTDLAKEMQVSPQQISKIVSGKENLSIETLTKLQTILNIQIFASSPESEIKHSVKFAFKQNFEVPHYGSQVQMAHSKKIQTGFPLLNHNFGILPC